MPSTIAGERVKSSSTSFSWIKLFIKTCEKAVVLRQNQKSCSVSGWQKLLGVWLATDPTETMNANYGEKLLKIQNTLSCWEKRRLSLLGKIAVLKSLVASQLVYILSPLPTNQQVIKAINKLFYNFLWNGKGDKIKRDVIINNYENGGLKMIDIKSFSKALKTTWVKKFLDRNNNGKCKLFFEAGLQNLGGTSFFYCNLDRKDLQGYVQSEDAFLALAPFPRGFATRFGLCACFPASPTTKTASYAGYF